MMTEFRETPAGRKESLVVLCPLPLSEERETFPAEGRLTVKFGIVREGGKFIELSVNLGTNGNEPWAEFDFGDEVKLTVRPKPEASPSETQVGKHNVNIERDKETGKIIVGISGEDIYSKELTGEDTAGHPLSINRPAKIQVELDLNAQGIIDLFGGQQTNFDEVINITAFPL